MTIHVAPCGANKAPMVPGNASATTDTGLIAKNGGKAARWRFSAIELMGEERMIRTGTMIIISVFTSACALRPPTDTFYQPNSVRLDTRTAQNQARDALMRADHISIDGKKANVSDVRFRNDGVGLLVNRQGQQTVQACYYSSMDLRVVKNNGFWPLEPQYIVGPICSGTGTVWTDSQTQATGLVDALYSLRNSSR